MPDTLPSPVPQEARARVGELIAAGYRQHKDGIEDPADPRVFWTFDQIVRLGGDAFRAVLARKRKR